MIKLSCPYASIVFHSEEQRLNSDGIQSSRLDRMMSWNVKCSCKSFFKRCSYFLLTETLLCSNDNLQVKLIAESLL